MVLLARRLPRRAWGRSQGPVQQLRQSPEQQRHRRPFLPQLVPGRLGFEPGHGPVHQHAMARQRTGKSRPRAGIFDKRSGDHQVGREKMRHKLPTARTIS